MLLIVDLWYTRDCPARTEFDGHTLDKISTLLGTVYYWVCIRQHQSKGKGKLQSELKAQCRRSNKTCEGDRTASTTSRVCSYMLSESYILLVTSSVL